MVKLSDVLKSFLLKIYLFAIIFVVAFGVNYLVHRSNDGASPIMGIYVSSGELAVTPPDFNQDFTSTDFTTQLKFVAGRASNDHFSKFVFDELKVALEDTTAENKLQALTSEEKTIVNALTISDIKSNMSVSVKENLPVFVVNFANKNAKIAQAVNEVIINSMYITLDKEDTDNILGNLQAGCTFKIDKAASLPTSATTSNVPNEAGNKSLSIAKLFILSFVIYVVIVILYEFVFAFITNKQKAITMVQTDMISTIDIPYFKNRKKEEKK